MSGFSLAHPAWLIAGLALVAAAEFARRRRPLAPALPLAFVRWFAGLPRSWRVRVAPWLARARVAALALVAVAAAGPAIAWSSEREERRGVDVLVALDASSSMTVALPGSFASTRFDAARAAAAEFASGRKDDRVGLLTFAGWPRLVCPLTWDHELFAAQLGKTRTVEAGSDEDQTAIGIALVEGVERLGAAADRGRVLVLVTDGVNNVEFVTPEQGARLCRDSKVRVHAIALGAGAPFGSGTPAPDVRLLREIAESTGGRAFAAEDRTALEDAWRMIGELEHGAIVRVAGERARAIGSPLLAFALLAWAALVVLEQIALRRLP